MSVILRDCRLGPGKEMVSILIEKGEIRAVEPVLQEDWIQGRTVIECDGYVAAPGFIDLHVHLREPGLEYKEDVKSGTMAAAKGGFTTVFSMPNTRPVMDDIQKLESYKTILKSQSCIKVMPVAAITKGLKGELLTDMEGLSEVGAKAFSDDGRPVYDDGIFRKAMVLAKKKDLLILDHCEDLELAHGGAINEGETSIRLGIKGINNSSEALPISRDVRIAEELGGRVHICHVSTAESVEIIRAAKQRGVRVTCEAGPHHFGLNDSIITEGFTDCKVNPPLRSEADRIAVLQGIVDGTVDVIATDHAPHHKTEKGSDFYKAAFGISGIETAFSVSYSELVEKGHLPFEKLVELMSRKPAEIAGLKAGRLEPGYPADIVLLDLEKEITIDKEKFLSKGHNTPFHGRTYKGEVVLTMVDGRVAYKR